MIHISRYTLRAKSRLNARSSATEFEGALVRIDDGFGCLHPWPALGDLPLNAQLDALRAGIDTDLTRQTRYCCAIDGQARRERKWLFEGVTIPPSHVIAGSLPDEEMAAFRFIKIKRGKQLAELSEKFPSAKFRLDFNESLTEPEFRSFLDKAPLDRIDFIEDPLPYNSKTWQHFNKRVPLAIDREITTGKGYQSRILKPARQELAEEPGIQTVVTSYMDHPLGQLFAAWQSTQINTYGCGLLTHLLFEETKFSEQLGIAGETLIPPKGTGLGFDDLLESLNWISLL